MDIIKYKKIFLSNYPLLFFFIVLIGIFLIFMPKYMDDYWFMINLNDWFYKQNIPDITMGGNIFKEGIPWKQIFETWEFRWSHDNGRLGNIIATILLLCPKWVGSSICLCAWIWCMQLSFELTNIKIANSPLVSAAIILWTLLLPWSNHMGVMVFQFNYLIPSALSLYLIKYLNLLSISNPKIKRNRKDPKRYLYVFWAFFLGLIVGWWHEGFSIPVAFTILIFYFFFKQDRNIFIIFSLIGLFIGILILVIAPGTKLRAAYNDDVEIGFLMKASRIIIYNVGYYLYLFVLLMTTAKIKIRNLFRDKTVLFCLISGIFPILMATQFISEARVTWWTQVISIIGILYTLNKYWGKYWRVYRINNLFLIIPALIFIYAHLIISDIYVIHINKVTKEGIQSYITNPEKSNFGDVVTAYDLPMITLRMPDVAYSGDLNHSANFFEKWTGKKTFNIIPQDLRYIDSQSGRPLEGNLNARVKNNLVFFEAGKISVQNASFPFIECDFGNGYKNVYSSVFTFRSEKDGKNYIYVNIVPIWSDRYYRNIKGIKIIQ